MVAESLKNAAKRVALNSRPSPMGALKRLTGELIFISLIKRPQPSSPAIFFQISKKTLPRAVDRNLIKRRLRVIMRGLGGQLATDQALIIGLRGKVSPLPSQTALKHDFNTLKNRFLPTALQ